MRTGKGNIYTLNPNFIDMTSKTDLILVVQVQTISSPEPQINKKIHLSKHFRHIAESFCK